MKKDKSSVPENKVTIRNINTFKFDSTQKGWRGPVNGESETLKITKLKKMQERQLSRQTSENVRVNRKTVDAIHIEDPDLAEQCEDNVSAVYDPDEMPVRPSVPFQDKDATWDHTTWTVPGKHQENKEKVQSFLWDKPMGGAEASSLMSRAQHIQNLEKELEKKDSEIQMLRDKLILAHKDNYKLTQELRGYTGKDYDELKKENSDLKQYSKRLQKENVQLRGYQRQSRNTTLQKLQYEEELEAMHTSKYPKKGLTQSEQDAINAKEDQR